MIQRLIPFLSLAILLAACAGPIKAYSGPTLSSTESASVQGWGVLLVSVAGVKVGVSNNGAIVAPGKNIIEFQIDSSNFQAKDSFGAPYKLELKAEAGKSYALTSARGNPAICAYELNPSTGDPNFGRPAGCAERQ